MGEHEEWRHEAIVHQRLHLVHEPLEISDHHEMRLRVNGWPARVLMWTQTQWDDVCVQDRPALTTWHEGVGLWMVLVID